MSINDFKMVQKIKKAKLILRTSDFKVSDIAGVCGFDNPSYFSEMFIKQVGVSPTDYRKGKYRY